MDCLYSLEPPLRGGSYEYPQSKFWAEIWNKYHFLSENYSFSVVKVPIYLNRRFFFFRNDSLNSHFRDWEDDTLRSPGFFIIICTVLYDSLVAWVLFVLLGNT